MLQLTDYSCYFVKTYVVFVTLDFYKNKRVLPKLLHDVPGALLPFPMNKSK